jgi:lipopolysaccharide transport system permease protein
VWREVKVRFSHTVLGVLWYVLQPLLLMVVITVGFRFVFPADVNGLPYPVFVASGLILWQYVANALMSGASGFERFQSIMNKVYVPKLALPMAGVAASLADLLAASLLLVPLMMYYRLTPSWRVVFVPVVIFGVVTFMTGVVLWLSIACVRYRDVRHVLPFATQLLFFASPIFVPHDVLGDRVRGAFALNPLVGYVDAFRWVVFESARPPDGRAIGLAIGVSLVLIVGGGLYFQRLQGDVVDII